MISPVSGNRGPPSAALVDAAVVPARPQPPATKAAVVKHATASALVFMRLRIRRRKKLSKGLRQAASPLLLAVRSAHGCRSQLSSHSRLQAFPRDFYRAGERLGVRAGHAGRIHD